MLKLLPSLLVLLSSGMVSALTLRVDTGAHDRSRCLVTFQAPASMRGQVYQLHPGGGPLQVDEAGRAAFLLPSSAAKGERIELSLAPTLPGQAASGVTAKQEGTTLQFEARSYAITPNIKPGALFTYQMQPGAVPEGTAPGYAHGAHLHPVFSPSGRLVTGNHPPDHPHQRGIWLAWTHAEFEGRAADFWNTGNDKHGGLTGEVRFGRLVKSWGGPVHGGFVSEHRWIDHTGGAEKDMLRESWEVTVHHTVGLNEPAGKPLPARHFIDLVSTQTCAKNAPVKLPKYHYGGLGVRGNALWDAVDQVAMLTSNGDDRVKGDATKAKWVWIGGEVEGATTGITVLIHPANFRFPQPLRLNPKNPQLCVAPSQDGDWSIEPGQPHVSRYRLVIADGKPDPAELERLWNDYAEPPKVDVAP